MSTTNREHYIPLRRADLVRMLAGDPALGPARTDAFRRFCDILSATLHFQYAKLNEQLKNTYAPFDPEATTVSIEQYTDDHRVAVLDDLFARVDELMARANFVRLSRADFERAATMRSEWGINMDVDFDLFERVQVYMRGDGIGQRARKSWWKLGKEEVVDVPIYQRLAIIIKLKKSKRFPLSIDTEDVFLKYFKEIPQADIEMLLPGARIVMPGIHRLKLGGSLVSGFGLLAWNIFKQLFTVAVSGVAYLWAPLFAVFGYGWRQYAGYQSARHACSLRLTESLYYQTLANNSGVLHSLLDEAEEQDAREAILAYHHLWRYGGSNGMTVSQLDAVVERDIEVRTGKPVDFEVDDALVKLDRMGLVRVVNGRYSAVPIDDALEILDHAWDNQFTYNRAA